MKKRLFVLPLLAGLVLSGCSIEDLMFWKKKSNDKKWDIVPEFASGTEDEKNAILQAINNLSPCVNKAGRDIFPDLPHSMNENDGDYIKVSKKILVDTYTVEFEWNVDKTQPTFESYDPSDAEHDIITVKYPKFNEPDGEFKWSMTKATCGSAVTSKTNCDYTAKVIPFKHEFLQTLISEINKVTDGKQTINGRDYPSTFDQVDYNKKSPYFYPNPGDAEDIADYHYVAVKGKVIYYAPDGNWLLLANGDQIVEVYAGSAYNLKPADYPAITNEYVEVCGNLSQYKGNIQIGFVKKIRAIEASQVTEPTVAIAGQTINSAFIESNFEIPAEYGYTCQKQAIDGFSNSIGNISGTIVPNSIKNDKGEAKTLSDIKMSARFTFDVSLGEKTITVAYDYHTDKDGSKGIFDALKAKLSSGGSISIKGTMRYNGNDSDPFVLSGNNGVWNIVPFEASHIA